MISGIAEMVLRIATIMLLIQNIGFQATAFADAVAWAGALSLNGSAFWVYYRKMVKAGISHSSDMSE